MNTKPTEEVFADAVQASDVIKPTVKVSVDAEEAGKVTKPFEEVIEDAVETKANPEKGIAVVAEVHQEQESDAAKAEVPILKEVQDMFCPDDELERIESKETTSVGTQTLESGIAPSPISNFGKDFYTLTYDDYSDED